MPRYLIEIRHQNEYAACVRALDAIVRAGSHLMTHAEWGCRDGDHAGYFIMDLPSREEALQMVPPQFRREAKVVEVKPFTKDEIREMMSEFET